MTLRLLYASDAWRVLNGLVCLYKPPGMQCGAMADIVTRNLARDLNNMKREDLSQLTLSHSITEQALTLTRETEDKQNNFLD